MAMVKTKVLDTEDTKLSVIPDDPRTNDWMVKITHPHHALTPKEIRF